MGFEAVAGGGLDEQAADVGQAVGPAVQGGHGFPLHFGLQGRNPVGGQVGQVGDNDIHRLRQGFQQVALEQRYAVGHIMHPHVVGGHIQGAVKPVGGIDACGRQVNGQVDGDGAGAGANVGNHQLPAFHAHQRHKQRVFYHRLRFGARYQGIGVDQQVDAVELPVVEDVGQRFAGQAAGDDGGQLRFLLGRYLGLLLGENGLAGHPHRVHHHHLGFQPGVGDAGGGQGMVGIADDGAQAGHSRGPGVASGRIRRWRYAVMLSRRRAWSSAMSRLMMSLRPPSISRWTPCAEWPMRWSVMRSWG